MQDVREKRYVSFSSAGTAGFSFIGCMRAVEVLMGHSEFELWRDRLEGIAGTSAGALFGLMFALRFSHAQTEYVKKSIDLRKCVSFANIDQCHTRLGFSDMDELRRYVHVILEEGGLSRNATMSDLHRFTRLHCVFRASNIMTRHPENISHVAHPHMRIDDAVCASCAIPLLYHPVEHEGALLVDGCLTGCLADVFDREATLFLKIEIPPAPRTDMGLVDYISSLFTFASDQACHSIGRERIHTIRLRNTSGFDPFASHQEIEREGLLSALTTFSGVDLYLCCGRMCREYARNVWEFTEDEEVPP